MNNFSKKYLNLFISKRSLLIVLICTCFYGCVQQPMRNNDLIKDQLNKKVEKSFSQKNESPNQLEWNLEFSEDFSEINIGDEPESIFILDGAYTVQSVGVNERCLLLPGMPMGDFGILFGPRIKDKSLELSFSFFASRKGRRMPSVAAGIGGVRGYRIRLNPAARKIILSMDETVFKEIPFSWIGDQWWNVRFRASPSYDSPGLTSLQFKLWPKIEDEPDKWFLSQEFKVEFAGGKCALWGYPYSSMPILFDDIKIFSN